MAQVKPIPPGMHTITPNLVVKDCAKAIEFYKKAFGAKEIMRMPTPDGKYVWHAELRIGDSVLYLNDEMPQHPAKAPTQEHPANFIQLYVENADAAFQRAVAAGAKSMMPLAEMFWGDRAGMVLDPFGYPWFIATHVKDVTEAEMRKAGQEFWRQMTAQMSQQGARQ